MYVLVVLLYKDIMFIVIVINVFIGDIKIC